MAKGKASAAAVDLAFFKHLWAWYREHRKAIRGRYNDLTRRLLDFNDPEKNPKAYLRRPQFEALEMYVFLKERLENKPVYEVFDLWYHREAPFSDRGTVGLSTDAQGLLFAQFDEISYKRTFEQMRTAASGGDYSNYIFALTMGTGKTILMATCIFYEFLLAHKYPRDPRYAHNALVFAPDKTVLSALREIQTFDRARVVPPDYVNALNNLLSFHFLEDAGTTLNVLNGSRYNLIISNTQKIILKRKARGTPAEDLFKSGKPGYKPTGAYAAAADLYAFDELDEVELSTNQRFEKLRRLEQLAVYIDEAHHAFGKDLARDLARDQAGKNSLRRTVDELASELRKQGTRVVACYNYTGTPYADGLIFPEVVYAFGLQEAIDHAFLKKVHITGYTNPKSADFVREALTDFFGRHAKDVRYEGLRPKIAFFASTLEELQTELRPAVEDTLVKLGVPTSTILVNVGDARLTSNDDLREFNRLDAPGSDKQVILLVGKGKEGWNCRSLFGVALFRTPKSKIFVLQATMRCLRAIAHPPQRTGHIYLSEDNLQILDAELNQNFRVALKTLRTLGDPKPAHEVHTVPPPRTLRLKRVRQLWTTREKEPQTGVTFAFDKVDLEKYRFQKIEQDTLVLRPDERGRRVFTDLSAGRTRRSFGPLSLTAEIARYLNRRPTEIEDILRASTEGMDEVVRRVNAFNELLYAHVIPTLFQALYEVEPFTRTRTDEVLLVREPESGAYHIQGDEDEILRMTSPVVAPHRTKSFHLDLYRFDSKPEQRLFLDLLRDARVRNIFFTGMLTAGQSDFYIEYIDPETHRVRTYYPDFLVLTEDGTPEGAYLIVEVKRDDQIEHPVVRAKSEATRQMANASRMEYRIIGGRDVMDGHATSVLRPEVAAGLVNFTGRFA